MSEEKKSVISNEAETKKEVSIENLGEVAGGAVFDVIPKAKEKNIADKERENI